MQNKLVENWLISAKELSFTTPFVQLLVTQGYSVLHVSRGGAVEQGKDIIALNKEGEVCCFQLKCGDIGTTEWYKIKGQIDELVQIAPVNAALKSEPSTWRCYLVTNGSIPNATARNIADYSKTMVSKNFMALETVTKDALVKQFVDGYGKFFPTDTYDLNHFLEMYCMHGDTTLNRGEFKKYIETMFTAYETKSKQKKLEALQASTIITSYLLTNKYAHENYVEIINAWLLLLFTVLHFANKWGITTKNVELIQKTILDEIEGIYLALFDDIENDNISFFDGTYGTLSEGIMTHKLRCTELLGYISAYMNYCILLGKEPYAAEKLMEKMIELGKSKIILGEYTSPLIYNYIVFLIYANQQSLAAQEMISFINGILQSYADDGPGMPSPYYDTRQAAEHALNLPESAIKESFQNRAYCLWSIVLLLAKAGQREVLNHHWLLLSFISNQEVIPEEANDLLLWRVEKAQLLDTFPNATQSWAELVSEANAPKDESLPAIIKTKKYLIPFLITAMPHRCTAKMVLSMLNGEIIQG